MQSAKDLGSGAALTFEKVVKDFGTRRVLSDVTLNIRAGEFVAVVGRSGSGKSTLLRLLCGLEECSQGALRVGGNEPPDPRSSVRVVFQEPRLLPWKSVLANVYVGIGAKNREHRSARDTAALRVLEAVGMADRANEYPGVLSGGQRQRVALARALMHEPSVLLLDEPFGALDALTRIEAQQLVESLWLERRFTALLVTHDVSEAVLLADRVVLIEEGKIAASFEVALERPRRRDNAELGRIASAVLDRIFASPDAARMSHASSMDGEFALAPAVSHADAKPAHA